MLVKGETATVYLSDFRLHYIPEKDDLLFTNPNGKLIKCLDDLTPQYRVLTVYKPRHSWWQLWSRNENMLIEIIKL